jgi:hypothetical protein
MKTNNNTKAGITNLSKEKKIIHNEITQNERIKKSKTTLKVQFKLCKYVVEQEIQAQKLLYFTRLR